MNYVQVCMRQGERVDVAWVEDKKIKPGCTVQVKKDDGTEETWTITNVYSKVDRNTMLLNRDAHKTQRQASDI